MKNTFGNSIRLTLFGESHGPMIGAVLDGLTPGIDIDKDFISYQLCLRRPSGDIATKRREKDDFRIVSGVFNGKTTGAPLCILIPNEDTRSEDYEKNAFIARPGHADFSALCKYHGFEDYRGGGHFSGRITAALVAAGAICLTLLKEKDIRIGSHIKRCAGIDDRDFSDIPCDIEKLNASPFAVLNEKAKEEMLRAIENAAKENDSVGGVIETAVWGLPPGVGEPWFDTLEGVLAHGLFSIPAVKGVEFGTGFLIADKKGSEANDKMRIENGNIYTTSNHNGGVIGGISNGSPLIFRCAVKPTPSILKPQETVDLLHMKNTVLQIQGRHDPAIVHRARVVVDSVAAIALCDMLALRFGTDWLKRK